MPAVGQAWITVTPSLAGFNRHVRQALRRELAGIHAEVKIEGDFGALKRDAAREGQTAGGEFAQQFRRRVEAALKSLPDVKIDADSTPAQREIAALREELRTLSERTVGIDLDAGEATAKIDQLKARLARLSAEDTSVDIDVDVAAASAHLAAIDQQVDRLDGRRVSVDVDVDRGGGAQAAFSILTSRTTGFIAAGALIGPTFVPALGAAAFGALGLASALAGASAGVGTLVAASLPALSAVKDAVTATEQAEKAAATSVLTTTKQRVGAAYQAQQAAQRVADAQQQADRTAVDGARQVEDAQRALADTRRDVAQRIDDANERVEDSERALQRSHEAVQRAQEELTEARREAVRVLEDLREQSSDLARSEEGAEIGLLRARERLAEVNRDATATALDRREAALDVAEAEDRLSDVQRDRRRTATELNAAERAGVSGSRQVVEANDRIRDASEGLADARRDNAEAQEDLARAEADGARTIADAERRVSDAQVQAAQANADAARAVGDAMQAQAAQAEQANLQAENGIAANRNLAYQLGLLTPLQRQLYDGWFRLRDAFTAWATSLEPAVIPLFLDGMLLIEQMLPRLTPLVLGAAGAFSILLAKASRALESPFWRDFFDFLGRTAGPAIYGFGIILGNVAAGFAGILMAFEPMALRVTAGLIDLSARFREWGTSLDAKTVEEMWGRISDSVGGFVDDMVRLWEEGLRPLLKSPEMKEFLRAWHDFHTRVWEKLIDNLVIFLDDVAPPLLEFLGRILDVMIALDDATGGAVASLAGLAAVFSLIASIPGVSTVISAVGTGLAGLIGSGPLAGVVGALIALFLWTQFVIDKWGEWASAIPLFTGPIGIAAFILGGLIVNLELLKDKMAEVVDWVRDNWQLLPLLLTGPLGIAYLLVVAHWETIKNAFFAAWHWVRDNVLKPLGAYWHDHIYPRFDAARDFVVRNWERIKGAFAAAWHWIRDEVLRPFGDYWNQRVVPKIRAARDTIAEIWRNLRRALANVWNDIIKAAGKAVNFVIKIINTITGAIEDIAGVLGFDIEGNLRIKPVKWGQIEEMQAGGAIDPNRSGPFITNGPRAIVGEGSRSHPEFVIPTDPKFRGRALGLFEQLGGHLMARGGVVPQMQVGGIIGGVGDVVGAIRDAASGLGRVSLDWLKGIGTWLKDQAIDWAREHLVAPVVGSAGGIARAYMGAVGGGVERWRQTGLQALRMTGSPASWINSLLRRMNQESGGNPNAINLWDINAQRGDPSMGLMQNIGSAYPSRVAAFPSLRGTSPFHPLGSIVASIVYANQRYGAAPIGWDRAGGYAMGGVLPLLGSYQDGTPRVPHDGIAFLHRDEAVLDASDAAMFRAAANGTVKGGRSYEQHNSYYGIVDYDEIARRTGDDLAWLATVGSH